MKNNKPDQGRLEFDSQSMPGRFVLWARSRGQNRRYGPWRAVASRDSEQELTSLLHTIPNGSDVITLPVGEHPDDRRRQRQGARR